MKPIIFNSDMVEAILDGRKTQTRRPIKGHKLKMIQFDAFNSPESYCPFGKIGDKLWVKETFKLFSYSLKYLTIEYKDGYKFRHEWTDKNPLNSWVAKAVSGKWKPSIHMPRWASRITLEITGIRVEKVQEITIEDIEKEGDSSEHTVKEGFVWFENLWNSIYKNWNDNPFVWVLDFKKEVKS